MDSRAGTLFRYAYVRYLFAIALVASAFALRLWLIPLTGTGAIAGLLSPSKGEVRVRGMPPRRAVAHVSVAYFARDLTLPGSVRARHWGSLATGDPITPERRRIRTLSRGTRQLLGLRTVLSRTHLALVVLDEPWEGLDVDGARWLSRTIEAKRVSIAADRWSRRTSCRPRDP